MKKIFLIGGTGFIGKQLVQQLVSEQVEILLLVRSKSKAITMFQESERLHENRLQFVEGDLTKKGLGLREEDQQQVKKCDVIIHAGGPMDISVSEQQATSAFLNGAKHVSELAQSIHLTKGLEQFIHVVGYMSPFDDDNSNIDIDVFQEGHQQLKIKNPYERTKFLADLYMRQHAKKVGYPLSVVNPPTVVGPSQTGSTEQVGGLGLLVKSMSKGLMPVVPVGRDYRLPLIANDALAKFIVRILKQQQPKSHTYTLVPDKQTDLNVPELLRIMAESMNVKAPTKSVPIQAMKLLLNSGGSKLTGIPADGLNFMTNRDFSNVMVKKVMGQHWFKETSVTTFLPAVIADLDYRIAYPNHQLDNRFNRVRIGNIVVYQKNGEGKPFILFHGLLSDGEDLFPLGIHLHEATGRPVWIVDFPGLGRSPFLKGKNTMTVYLHTLKDVLVQAFEGAHFIGHSFGAFILLAAFKEHYFRSHDTITLLQPPMMKKSATTFPGFMKKWVLKNASLNRLKKYVLDTGLFGSAEQIPMHYMAKVKSSFNSPRILNTTVLLDEWLSKKGGMEMNDVESSHFQIIWGDQDKAYRPPTKLGDITMLPYGHHFPLSHPNETAHVILETVKI
ncbi:alpha/beta fold hydrolase [Bacillus salipaludis]|uniref:Alpha/beta fold hydrolase n=1 Tax=Bacillus salipaludis TaxID=2547811 RepID=A0AA90TWJ6_9BACI|nr:alpha/beta fold hydrolase [Bacillus salipaludis]MDQ6600796.1 alpha/beta fold hydrolase [Bacillus salipaludis]